LPLLQPRDQDALSVRKFKRVVMSLLVVLQWDNAAPLKALG